MSIFHRLNQYNKMDVFVWAGQIAYHCLVGLFFHCSQRNETKTPFMGRVKWYPITVML